MMVFLLAAASVHAQEVHVSTGLRVGLNLTTFRYPNENPFQNPTAPAGQNTVSSPYRPGLEVGFVGSINRGHFALQPALLYSQKGCHLDYDNGYPSINGYVAKPARFRARYNYLTLPLSLAYALRPDGEGLQVFAGPYVGLLLGGSYETEDLSATPVPTGRNEVIPGNVEDGDGRIRSRRFDAGVQMGVGFRCRNLLAQLDYSMGLRNIAADFLSYGQSVPEAQPAYHNRGFQGSIGYLFGSNK